MKKKGKFFIENVFSRLSRRSFLKTAGAVGAMGVLAGCSGSSEDQIIYVNQDTIQDFKEDTLVPSACRANCWNNCRLFAHVREVGGVKRVVKTSMAPMPDPRYNRACLRGLSHVQRIYHNDRVKYPMKRIGKRGEGKFERISWATAITEIADSFKSILNDPALGKRSIAFLSGSGNYASVHGIMGGSKRLFNCLESVQIASSLDMALPVGLERVMGTNTFPFFQNNEPADMLNSKTIITWASNVAESQVQTWHFIADAIERNGAQLISIDVAFNSTAARAHQFVNVAPGSDTILALHMINYLIKKYLGGEKRYLDEYYMVENTVAPFLVDTATNQFITDPAGNYVAMQTLDAVNRRAEYTVIDSANGNKHELNMNLTYDLMYSGPVTTNNGTYAAKTAFRVLAEHTESQCVDSLGNSNLEATTGVSESVMIKVADTYALNKPSTIYTGFGCDHYTNGHHHAQAVAVLGAITGNIGIKGGGVGLYIPMTPFQSGDLSAPSNGRKLSDSIPYPKFTQVFSSPAMDAQGNGNEKFKGVDTKIRAMFTTCVNPVSNWVQQGTDDRGFIKALTAPGENGEEYKIRTIVVPEMSFTDTAMYADYVLPVAHWFEAEDFDAFSTHPYLLYQEQAIKPLYECEPDMNIARMLAEKLGFANEFTKTNEEFFDTGLDPAAYKAWYKRYTGAEPDESRTITAEKLRKEKILRFLPGTTAEPYIFPMQRNGSSLVFSGKSSGRLEIFAPMAIRFFDYGQAPLGIFVDPAIMQYERMPSWETPTEAWNRNTTGALEDEQFVYMQEHTRWRVHTQWFNVPWLREFDPNPIVKINETDANARSIVTGDLVKIYNDRGHAVAKAVVTKGQRKGVINIPKGWQRSQFAENFGADAGGYQEMTSNAIHPVSVNQSFFDALVKISKVS